MSDGRADLDSAIARLEQAVSGLEVRVRGLQSRPAPDLREDDLFAPRGPSPREEALERAAREASVALDQAAAEIRAVLEEA